MTWTLTISSFRPRSLTPSRLTKSSSATGPVWRSSIQKKLLLPPLCVEDAERVEDPILFVRPCKCIEDARSLVLRLDLPGASQRNFNQINTSCLAMKVPLRGTFVQLCVDQAARTYGPLAWSLDNLGCTRLNSSKLGSALVCTRFRTNSFFEAFLRLRRNR